ncbi:MAG: hypothetical protein HQL53_02375, partial [Magnetococcales bacterium]|nr:hypothetical protein [Magnetococcales bacterium]
VTTTDGTDSYTSTGAMDVEVEADVDGLTFDTSYAAVENDAGGEAVGDSGGGGKGRDSGGGSKGGDSGGGGKGGGKGRDSGGGSKGGDSGGGGKGGDSGGGGKGDEEASSDDGGNGIELEIGFALEDQDGSESLSGDIVITDVPMGAELSAGTDNGDGTWSISQDELSVTQTNDDGEAVAWEIPNLTMTAPEGSEGDYNIGIQVSVSDGENIETSSGSMDVTIDETMTTDASGTSTSSVVDDGSGLVLNIAKGGNGNTGEFEVIINGESVGTFTTDTAFNSTGEWDSMTIDGVDTSNIESISIEPTSPNSHILVNSISIDGNTLEAETDADSSKTVDQGDYLKINNGGEVSFEVNLGEVNTDETAFSEMDATDDGNQKGDDSDDTLIADDSGAKLEGKDGDDVLYGGEGDDELKGGDGDDTLYGNEGDDEMEGGDGDDTLYAGEGDDTMEGGDGNDVMYGGTGNDEMEGGDGDDTMYGGDGNDIFTFGDGSGLDSVNGGAGDGWTDSIQLDGADGGPSASLESAGDWTIETDSAYSIDEGSGEIVFDDEDASGTINMFDGSSIDFDNIEKIEW